MSSSTQSINYNCNTLLLKPYEQGIKNLRDAWMAQRIEDIAAVPGDAPTTRELPLSLMGRVTTAVIGVLLLVPIINTLVLLILQQCDSPCLYAPFRQPTDPYSQEILGPIRTAALARMGEIETMEGNLWDHFEVTPQLTTFRFDEALEGSPSYQGGLPFESCFDNLMDWAEVDRRTKGKLKQLLGYFNQPITGIPELSEAHKRNIAIVTTMLSKMQAYFVIEKQKVESDAEGEVALKRQFQATIHSLCLEEIPNPQAGAAHIPNEYFIYTTMNALQDIMLSATKNSPIARQRSSLGRLHFRVAQIICKAKITGINQGSKYFRSPGHKHLFMKVLSIAPRLNPFGAVEGNLSDEVDTFRRQEASPCIALHRALISERSELHDELMQWANHRFRLGIEDVRSASPLLQDREMLGHIFNRDNGQVTATGIFFLLEAAGLMRVRETAPVAT